MNTVKRNKDNRMRARDLVALDPRQALAIDLYLGFVRRGRVPIRPAIPDDDAYDDQAPGHGRRRRGAPALDAGKATRLRRRERRPLVDVPEPRVGVRLALRMIRVGMDGSRKLRLHKQGCYEMSVTFHHQAPIYPRTLSRPWTPPRCMMTTSARLPACLRRSTTWMLAYSACGSRR